MNDNTLHTISRLFLILTIALLAATCATYLAWPFVLISTTACCIAVHLVCRKVTA